MAFIFFISPVAGLFPDFRWKCLSVDSQLPRPETPDSRGAFPTRRRRAQALFTRLLVVMSGRCQPQLPREIQVGRPIIYTELRIKTLSGQEIHLPFTLNHFPRPAPTLASRLPVQRWSAPAEMDTRLLRVPSPNATFCVSQGRSICGEAGLQCGGRASLGAIAARRMNQQPDDSNMCVRRTRDSMRAATAQVSTPATRYFNASRSGHVSLTFLVTLSSLCISP